MTKYIKILKIKNILEDDFGGDDPYSSSKSCADLISLSYKYSFLNNSKIEV